MLHQFYGIKLLGFSLNSDRSTANLVAPGWIPTQRHADTTQEELDNGHTQESSLHSTPRSPDSSTPSSQHPVNRSGVAPGEVRTANRSRPEEADALHGGRQKLVPLRRSGGQSREQPSRSSDKGSRQEAI